MNQAKGRLWSPEAPSATAPDRGGASTYRFDPSSLVPAIGGSTSSPTELGPVPRGLADPALAPWSSRMEGIFSPGGLDQVEAPRYLGSRPPYLPLGPRPDVLAFQAAPLKRQLEVTGPIEVRLCVASSAPDTGFTAQLIDLYPPSLAYPLGYTQPDRQHHAAAVP